MGDVLNLNKARKARDKAEKTAKASENRTRFGRTPLQKALDAAEAQMRNGRLDGAKRDRD